MHEHDPQLRETIDQLDTYAIQLRLLGLVIAFITVVLIGASFFATAFRGPLSTTGRDVLTSLVIVGSLGNLLLLLIRELTRKRGDVLYEELTDELQWEVINKSPFTSHEPSSRPSLDIRIALRSYARTSDLPLAPGRYGEAGYALLTVMLTAYVSTFGYLHY